MIGNFFKKIIGTKNEREIKRLDETVDRINALEPSISSLTNTALRQKTEEFRSALSAGKTLDDILPEAFAVVREASKRTIGLRHYDVQLIGGMILHEGKIAEMKTGEGKTLVATLPVYLNALPGLGVHVVTVNDYLARRDSQWMGQIYKFLGLSVGVILHGLNDRERQVSYGSDVVYGTNNEFGFDYLRDNMKFDASTFVQRELNYAIVDEVDSILIDEARTPLIISGSTEESTDKYYKINKIIPHLKKETDYTVEEKTRTVALTEDGNAKVEQLLGLSNLYDISNMDMVHHVVMGLKAHIIFKRDVDYVVKDGEVLIVDEFTGRLMPGRRYSDGLHQALEAKENVTIAQENQTLASITFQNYFRLYNKLAGMTGTADTEAAEFQSIYNLDVVVIPPNKPMIRIDNADQVYKTEREKFNAVADEITERNKRGQPVLVGTVSIENSEKLSDLLKKKGIKHTVLNAKFHEMEAEIVAQAGRKGAVTIATNMAGRGTDILLGGNPEFLAKREFAGKPDLAPEEHDRIVNRFKLECDKEKEDVIAAGGLHIIGSERHEARRIDNQLRGRSGRQGDPGSSRFYLALEDDLMRIFGSDKIAGLMNRLGMEEGTPIEHRMVSKAIENAQKKVESHNFDIRKHLIEYDDVMNQQRTVIYSQRRQILQGEGLTDIVFDMIEDLVDEFLATYCGKDIYPEEWDIKGLKDALTRQFALEINDSEIDFLHTGIEGLKDILLEKLRKEYADKESEFSNEVMRQVEKVVLLQVVDTHWKDHLLSMDHLKEGIGLRGYGQKDPLIEYKREGFDMFNDMINRIKADAVERVFKIQIVRQPEPVHHDHKHHQPHVQQQSQHHQPNEQTQSQPQQMNQPPQPTQVRPAAISPSLVMRPQRMQLSRGIPPPQSTTVHKGEKVGRNDPCTCGSGKKFKKCHGA
ncbi:MAG: preprotein translocase subunit SecA [Nitrospirae bacterium]|nr:preprotein translocase subunit SecA [Nitrospirota bacterium]